MALLAAAEAPLPTLLTSRPRGPTAAAAAEPLKKRRPAPVALVLPEDEEPAAEVLRVKNTFLEGTAPRSPSLDTFFKERAVRTCPSSHVGRLAGLFEETVEAAVGVPLASPLGIQTPCSMQTPFAGTLPQGTSLPVSWWGLSCAPDTYALGQPAVPSTAQMPGTAQQHQAGGRTVLNLEGALGGADVSMAALPAQSPWLGMLAEPLPHYSDFLGTQLPANFVPQLLPNPGTQMLPNLGLQMVPNLSTQLPPNLSTQMVPNLSTQLVPDLSMQPVPGASSQVAPQALPTYGAAAALDAAGAGDLDIKTMPMQPPAPPAGPAPGSPELPSLGSAGHEEGTCKPCAFFHTRGCTSGPSCKFCHLCGPEEQKLRRKQKIQQLREASRVKQEGKAAAA